jgi:uncharacterized protein with HEPN domain
MSMRSDDLHLVDLIESAEAIDLLVRGLSLETFANDDRSRSAVLWKLVIVGEASSRLSSETRDQFVEVPWDQIRAFRNRMVHGYFTLRWSLVWEIATHGVPMMRRQAEAILARGFPDVYRQLQERRRQDGTET